MRILRIYPFLPPIRGGMEKHVLRLTQEQRILGCKVVIAYNSGDRSAPNDVQVLGSVDLRKIRPQVLRDIIFYFFLFIRVFSHRSKYDAVHVHGDSSAFILGRLISVFLGASKLVASLHGAARKEWVYRVSLSGYDLLYCTGAREARRLTQSLSDLSVCWRHSGIDSSYIDSKRCTHKGVDVVWAGSFVQVKNVPLILDIAEKMKDVTFRLVGDGPQRDIMERRSLERGLENIEFTGHLSSADLIRNLSTARIFLLTSFSEGTPTAVLEAMACGLAIVTSESNDYSQLLVEGKNGFVVHNFDSSAYESKIQLILQNTQLWEEMSVRNKNEALSFGWPEVAIKITRWMQSSGSK